MPPVETALYCY